MSEQREVYTVEQAGARLGLSKNSAYEAVKRGDIPSIKIGRRILIPKLAFDRMLERGTGTLAPAAQDNVQSLDAGRR
jgi:excisionase family DNA binding protein